MTNFGKDGIKYNTEDLVDHHGVSAVIKNSARHILMQEHAKYGFWTIPVGKVKTDQDIIVGLKKEVLEETDLQVESYRELAYKAYEYIRNGINVKVFTHLFEIIKYNGIMKNMEPKKHLQQKFMSIEEIVKLSYLSDTILLYLSTLGIKRVARI